MSCFSVVISAGKVPVLKKIATSLQQATTLFEYSESHPRKRQENRRGLMGMKEAIKEDHGR